MESEFNVPMIDATIWYFDDAYSEQTAEQILLLLEKYGFFPPIKINLGKYTKNRFLNYKEEMRTQFVEACSTGRELSIGAATGDGRKIKEYWTFNWCFTYEKCHKDLPKPKFKAWNTLSLHITYGLARDNTVYENFLNFFREAVKVLKPFYANIDDISNGVELLHAAQEETFTPNYVQQVYWGNYFGKEHCEHFGMDKLMAMPAHHIEQVGEGVFFTLCENALDFASLECQLRRTLLWKYLSLADKKRYLAGGLYRPDIGKDYNP